MPRRPRLRLAGIPFHVIQRGNNRSACFFAARDYLRYLDDLALLAAKHDVAVHAYVLMTNHVHLLVTPQHADGLPLLMKFLGQRYVQYVNRTYGRTGSLWEGRYRSCLVDAEGYLLCCHRYIEANPVRAGMVAHPADYRWSSYRANADGDFNSLLTVHPAIEALGVTPEERRAVYRELFQKGLEASMVEQIRSTTNGGFALGSERFQRQISEALQRRAVPAPNGRKKRPVPDLSQLPPSAA